MPKLVQKCSYIKSGKAAGYMKYIATRERVEKLSGAAPATEKQQALVRNLLRDFPDTKELHEYKDYHAAPTAANASAFISMALDMNAEKVQTRDGYMQYIATRPRAERHGEHGLFGSEASVSLDAAMGELAAHEGNVWTIIYSLRREDAQRLGYDHAEAWRTLLRGKQVEMANTLKIPPDKLRWYAAFHDEDTHPHIHLMLWSEDPKQGYLSRTGVEELRSVMTRQVFQDELTQLYRQKDMSYKEVTQAAREALRTLMQEMAEGFCHSPEVGQQLQTLAFSLPSVKGKKQYGYLKKPLKEQVDRIVHTLSELPVVAECYEAWNVCKDAQVNYYRERERERLPLSRQEEFRSIKNMVIREAERLRQGIPSFEDRDMAEEPINEDEVYYLDDEDARAYFQAKAALYDSYATREEKAEAVSWLEHLAEKGSGEAALLLGKAWRDGLCAPPWEEEAERWFRVAAEAGNSQARYDLGVLLLEQGKQDEGIDLLVEAANLGNAYAMYQLGKEALTGTVMRRDVSWALTVLTYAAEAGHAYAQYNLGKLYLQGEDVPEDREQALYWLGEAAAQGHAHAEYLLEHLNDEVKPLTLLAATRLLHHLSRVFREAELQPPDAPRLRIDRKRARQLMEKRLAMGHKPDDHEQEYNGPTMTMR